MTPACQVKPSRKWNYHDRDQKWNCHSLFFGTGNGLSLTFFSGPTSRPGLVQNLRKFLLTSVCKKINKSSSSQSILDFSTDSARKLPSPWQEVLTWTKYLNFGGPRGSRVCRFFSFVDCTVSRGVVQSTVSRGAVQYTVSRGAVQSVPRGRGWEPEGSKGPSGGRRPPALRSC